jgi:hypothetical protein
MWHKVLEIDGVGTYVPPFFEVNYLMTIATGVASQFIFDSLIFLIFISRSLNVLEP